jgi:hypothetical protein
LKEHGAFIFKGQSIQEELLAQHHITEDLKTPLAREFTPIQKFRSHTTD